MTGLSDQSRDRCSPPESPVGNGRFEGGRLRIGQGDRAQEVDVSANGTDFLESIAAFYISALLRDAAGNNLCTTVIVSSPAGFSGNSRACTDLFTPDPEGLVSFDLRLSSQCSWDETTVAAKVLEIGGVPFRVTSTGPVRREDDHRLATVRVEAGESLRFRLVDDDATAEIHPVNVSLLQDVDDPNTNVFAAAYVRPRQLVYENRKTATFMRNIDSFEGGSGVYFSPQGQEARSQGKEDAFPTSPGYWVAYLQAAFQEDEKRDDDSQAEHAIFGLASGNGALIFTESLRDNAESSGDCSPLTPAHEVGHMFGIPDILAPPDSDLLMLPGLMSYSCRAGNAFFPPEHLRIIRKRGIK